MKTRHLFTLLATFMLHEVSPAYAVDVDPHVEDIPLTPPRDVSLTTPVGSILSTPADFVLGDRSTSGELGSGTVIQFPEGSPLHNSLVFTAGHVLASTSWAHSFNYQGSIHNGLGVFYPRYGGPSDGGNDLGILLLESPVELGTVPPAVLTGIAGLEEETLLGSYGSEVNIVGARNYEFPYPYALEGTTTVYDILPHTIQLRSRPHKLQHGDSGGGAFVPGSNLLVGVNQSVDENYNHPFYGTFANSKVVRADRDPNWVYGEYNGLPWLVTAPEYTPDPDHPGTEWSWQRWISPSQFIDMDETPGVNYDWFSRNLQAPKYPERQHQVIYLNTPEDTHVEYGILDEPYGLPEDHEGPYTPTHSGLFNNQQLAFRYPLLGSRTDVTFKKTNDSQDVVLSNELVYPHNRNHFNSELSFVTPGPDYSDFALIERRHIRGTLPKQSPYELTLDYTIEPTPFVQRFDESGIYNGSSGIIEIRGVGVATTKLDINGGDVHVLSLVSTNSFGLYLWDWRQHLEEHARWWWLFEAASRATPSGWGTGGVNFNEPSPLLPDYTSVISDPTPPDLMNEFFLIPGYLQVGSPHAPNGILRIGAGGSLEADAFSVIDVWGDVRVENAEMLGNLNFRTLSGHIYALGSVWRPGNSVGHIEISGDAILGGDDTFQIEIANFTEGAKSWDTLHFESLEFSSTDGARFLIELSTLDPLTGLSGLAADFDSMETYSIPFITTNSGISGFVPSQFTLDVSQIQNDFSLGHFSLELQGNSLALIYRPGPATLLGDFDQNGAVDGADFLLWQRNPSVGSLADWHANFGTSLPRVVQLAVPEPHGGFACLCVAAAAVGACRGRRSPLDTR